MHLTSEQQSVVTAMRDGADLIVHSSKGGATLVVEGKSAQAIGFDTWRPIYGFDLMRRGQRLEGTAQVYNLTEHGRTANLEPEEADA